MLNYLLKEAAEKWQGELIMHAESQLTPNILIMWGDDFAH